MTQRDIAKDKALLTRLMHQGISTRTPEIGLYWIAQYEAESAARAALQEKHLGLAEVVAEQKDYIRQLEAVVISLIEFDVPNATAEQVFNWLESVSPFESLRDRLLYGQ